MRVSIRNHAHSARSRALRSAFTILLGLICASCGETYRPVAQPIQGLQPNPAPAHIVSSINSDGVGDNHRDRGSVSSINVSGDSLRGELRAGMVPVHAGSTASGSLLYIANSGDDTVSVSNVSSPTGSVTISLPASPSATITQATGNGSTASYTYTGGTGLFAAGDRVYVSGCTTNGFNGAFTITAASANSFSVSNSSTTVSESESFGAQAKIPNAVFVNSAENASVFVAGYGTDALYVINANTQVVTAVVPVDSHPVAVAQAPAAQKVYVANQGNSASGGSVSVVDTVSNTVAKTICLGGGTAPSCSTGPVPVWAVARADSGQVYVLDENGTVYAIDTASDSVVASSASGGVGANFMFYDRIFNRLYVTSHFTNPVTNTSSNSLSIFDVSSSTPSPSSLTPITIPAASGSPCAASAVVPTSVTVLGDGSRAYVASYQLPQSPTAGTGTVCTQLSVIDTGSETLSKTIALSQVSDTSAQTGCGTVGFRVFAASSGGGSNSNFKVFVSQCDAGTVAVVHTYPANGKPENTYTGLSLETPLSTFPALSSGIPPTQNPMFLVAGP